MTAGIVGTDIRRKAAGALLAGWLLRGQPQGTVQRGLESPLRHAAAAIGTIAGQRSALGAGSYHHAVFSANLNKSLSQCFALSEWDAFHLRKIPPSHRSWYSRKVQMPSARIQRYAAQRCRCRKEKWGHTAMRYNRDRQFLTG